MDQQPSWPVRQAQEIGQRIEHFRTKAGMSARQLASRCAELGMPSISRTVITKLENGRREAVSTAELQVLAAALEMPPVLLLFPLGHQATSEVLPGRAADPWSAIQWFTGYSDDPADAAAPPPMGTQSPLILWDEHLRYDQAIADARENLAEAKASGNREGVPYLTDYLTGSVCYRESAS
jgi:transcriptional regulator with XRE-family HTH domain